MSRDDQIDRLKRQLQEDQDDMAKRDTSIHRLERELNHEQDNNKKLRDEVSPLLISLDPAYFRIETGKLEAFFYTIECGRSFPDFLAF